MAGADDDQLGARLILRIEFAVSPPGSAVAAAIEHARQWLARPLEP
jgi:hypothetical protein